jgi:hypothetical protein
MAVKRLPKDARFMLKVDRSEKKAAEELAARRHTTVSDLFRQLLHRELDNEKKVEAA